MKILLDENLPHALRAMLSPHEVYTVSWLGWAGTKNGALLQRAAEASFDVVLTMDNGVAYQQNMTSLPVSVLIISAPSNDIDDLKSLLPAILHKIDGMAGCTIDHVP